jgi:hypothetical protein
MLRGFNSEVEEKKVQNVKRTSAMSAFYRYHSDISENIRNCDHKIQGSRGIGNRFSGELKNRLRLYKNSVFRNKMIKKYTDIVLPRMSLYEEATIKRVFTQFQQKSEKEP